MPSGNAARALGVVSIARDTDAAPLALELGDDVAATLRAAYLRDVLVAAASVPGASATLLHPGEGDTARLAALALPGVRLELLGGNVDGGDLATALRGLLEGAQVAALLWSDAPGLPASSLRQAFEAIEGPDFELAIGPTREGGLYLLAANGDYPELLGAIDWDAGQVSAQVGAGARELGLRVYGLPERRSASDLAGLEHVASELASNGALHAEATRTALRDLREAGHPVPAGEPPWRVEEQRVIYSSPWRTLVTDRLETHAGETIDYAYLQTDQAVWVVPVTDDGRVLLIRQYRHPIGRFIVEVPAGGGEGDPEAIARRELAEETGGRAGRLIYVASYYPASAHTTHRGHVYVALDIEFGSAELESTELLSVFSVPFELALDMARRGEIGDTQSALAVLAAEPVIRAALAGRSAVSGPE